MKQLVYGNQQCPETIEEVKQQVEVVTATVRGTPGGLSPINKHVATF